LHEIHHYNYTIKRNIFPLHEVLKKTYLVESNENQIKTCYYNLGDNMNYAKINKIFNEMLDDVDYLKRKTYIVNTKCKKS